MVHLESMEKEFEIINPAAWDFKEKYFPAASREEWNSWTWQMGNRITSREALAGIVKLSEAEEAAFALQETKLPFSVTPYYAHLINREAPLAPVRRTVIPVIDETHSSPVEDPDPVKEGDFSPVPCIVHRYPDRVLFLVAGSCSTYCRYCNRSRVVGTGNHALSSPSSWERGLEYIRQNNNIRDVLISGGDPLTLPDESLQWLLEELKKIPHVEYMRISTKMPVVLPQRITNSLVEMLKRYHPLWMSIHFTHPEELTPEVREACRRIADAGIPMGSHTVLLKGINNSPGIIKQLYHDLLVMRVKPYYLFQCDAILGSSHFRTPIDEGPQILEHLQGYTTGYAVPMFVIDIPGGGGKSPIFPNRILREEGDYLIVKNYKGEEYRFPHSREKG